MLYFVKGDIFTTNTVALVNPVNCVGVAGKGLALEFKIKFPDNFGAYKQACEKGLLVPGKVFVYETNLSRNPRYIINFPTKKHWRSKSNIEYIIRGLKDLRNVIIEKEIKSISIPALGCGLGGLPWKSVKYWISSILSNLDFATIFVFEPI